MEDNWIKILIFVAIILYNLYSAANKKKKEKEAEAKRKEELPEPIQEKPIQQTLKTVRREPKKELPVSLQDLMREFGMETEDKKIEAEKAEPRKAPESVVIPIKKYDTVDYDNIAEDEDQKVLKKLKRDQEAMAEMRKPRILPQDEHFVPYADNKAGENKYAAMLKNPETAKQVFVASEIFKPKHF